VLGGEGKKKGKEKSALPLRHHEKKELQTIRVIEGGMEAPPKGGGGKWINLGGNHPEEGKGERRAAQGEGGKKKIYICRGQAQSRPIDPEGTDHE